jgi:hypothetical protein
MKCKQITRGLTYFLSNKIIHSHFLNYRFSREQIRETNTGE